MSNKKLAIIIILILGIILSFITLVVVLVNDKNEVTNQTINSTNLEYAINNPVEKFDDWSNLIENDNYIISYSEVPEKTYSIIINNNPVLEISKKAENDFISKYNLTTEDACNMNLIIKVPFAVNEKLSGYTFAPSFCPNKLHIDNILN